MTRNCMRVLVSALALTAVLASAVVEYSAINGLLCMKSQFIVTHEPTSTITCAHLCTQLQDCQGFTVATGPCQMFVFNKCSRNFRNCNCAERGQVFVKRLPGLPPGGSLCPSGFDKGNCGTKYKLFAGKLNWTFAKAAIDAEAGLVTMADLVDSIEYRYLLNLIVFKYSYGYSPGVLLMLGGRPFPGSEASNKNSWYWVGCNTTISSSLWHYGEPNNGGDQYATYASSHYTKGLIDSTLNEPATVGALAECVSPFDD